MKFFFLGWLAGFSGFLQMRLGWLFMRYDADLNVNIKENLKKAFVFGCGFVLFFESTIFMERPNSIIFTIVSLLMILYSFFFSKDYLE